MHNRGSRTDYNKWGSENSGWSYQEVLPYLKKLENVSISLEDVEYRGHDGPMRVELNNPTSPLYRMFIEGSFELGMKYLDFNGEKQLGVSQMQKNTIKGRRMSTSKAYLKPIRNRKNLSLLGNSYVMKILINNFNVAKGVKFVLNGKIYVAYASKEVILSAGSVGSAQILMLSGIGPKKLLREVGIKVKNDLEVGQQMSDHVSFYGLHINTNYTEDPLDLKKSIKEYLNGYGILTHTGNGQGIGFIKVNPTNCPNPDCPDSELLVAVAPNFNQFSKENERFTEETAEAVWANVKVYSNVLVRIVVSHPRSRGSIRLKSSDPFVYPLINPNCLSDPEDVDVNTMYLSIQHVLKLLKTRAFKERNAKWAEIRLPACKEYEFMSKEFWYCTIRQISKNANHPIATCKMGSNPSEGDVVDAKLKVYGVRNLRVCDASVLPFQFSDHPAVDVMMLGEKFADILKVEYLPNY